MIVLKCQTLLKLDLKIMVLILKKYTVITAKGFDIGLNLIVNCYWGGGGISFTLSKMSMHIYKKCNIGSIIAL